MGVGLQVLNDSGAIQIDENYNNLFLVAKNTYNLANGGNFSTSQQLLDGTFKYTPQNRYNIVAISPTVSDGKLAAVFTLQDGKYAIEAGGEFTIYEFGKVSQAVGNSGLQVFRADGSVAFDSNQNPMRVLKQFNDTYSDYSTRQGEHYQVPQDKRVAVVFSNQHVERFSNIRTKPSSHTFANFTAYVCMRFNSGEIYPEWGMVDLKTKDYSYNVVYEPDEEIFQMFGSFFVIDVTYY